MTKQELIVQMMDGEWWTYVVWDDHEEIMWNGATFINRDGSVCDLFEQLENHKHNLDGFHHYEEPKEQVEAWLWLVFDNINSRVDITTKPYANREDVLKNVFDVRVLHKCSETLTMIDKD